MNIHGFSCRLAAALATGALAGVLMIASVAGVGLRSAWADPAIKREIIRRDFEERVLQGIKVVSEDDEKAAQKEFGEKLISDVGGPSPSTGPGSFPPGGDW
jgi:hypothetical protein